MKDTAKKHVVSISVILLLILIVFHAVLDTDTILLMDHVTSYYPRAEILKQSMMTHKDFIPLWNPYMGGGQPFFPKADVQGFFNIPTLFLLIMPTTLIALKATYLFDILFAGLAMYALVYYLKKDNATAIIGALIYSLNGWIISRFEYGNLTSLNAYVLFPLILIFIIKAFKEEKTAFNSVIAGILLAIQIHAGPDLKVTLFTLMAFAIFCVFQIFESFSNKSIKKTATIIIIIGLVSFGLTAVKILPTKETLKLSPRQHLPYEQSASRPTHLNEFFEKLIEPIRTPTIQAQTVTFHIGIIAFLLCCFAWLKKWKSKTTIYLTVLIITSLLLASGSFLYYLLWRFVPPFDSFRYLDRILVLYVFAASILAAFGASALFEHLKEKKKWSDEKITITKAAVILLIFLNIGVLGNNPYYGGIGSIQDAIDNNQAIQYISKQPGIFRMHTFETRGIDWPVEPYSVPLWIGNIYAYDGSWNTEYFNVFLSNAFISPAKMWGILNVKYLTSMQQLNLTGFKFINKFEPCKVCFPNDKDWEKAWGPYLYENELALPRAMIIPTAILLVGGKSADIMTPVKQATYAVLLNPSFDPRKTVLVTKEIDSIDEMTPQELRQFDAILLIDAKTGPATRNLLEKYAEQGGKILPNILTGENTVTQEQLSALLSDMNKTGKIISDNNIQWINFETQQISFDKPQKGWLVMSETYSLYPGWTAHADGQEIQIYKADGAITAVYLKSPTESIKFEYSPPYFVAGEWIFVITAMLIITYFIAQHILGKNKMKREHQKE